MRLTKAKMRELFKREAVLENNKDSKKDSKKEPNELICIFVEKCYHADIECACTCGKHGVESLLDFRKRPATCLCRQFHKPPQIPCGCVSMAEMYSIEGFNGFKIAMAIVDKKDKVLRKVPGMYRYSLRDSKGPFEVYRKGEKIIKLNGGKEEVLVEFPNTKVQEIYSESP